MEWAKLGIGRREGEVERKGFEGRKNRVMGIRGFLVCNITNGDVYRTNKIISILATQLD